MSSKKLKPLPDFATDEEAERFVDEADLTEFDLSGARSVVVRASTEQPAPSRTTAFRFEIYKDRSGSFHFQFLAAGGEVTFSSEAFQTKAEALMAIESIRANADGATIVDRTLAA